MIPKIDVLEGRISLSDITAMVTAIAPPGSAPVYTGPTVNPPLSPAVVQTIATVIAYR